MSFNIRYDNKWDTENNWESRKNKIIKLIENYKPDILATQEGLYNQITFSDSALTDYTYVGIGREDGKVKGEFCVIFYNTKKYEIIKQLTFSAFRYPTKVSVGWDAAPERISTYALFKESGNPETNLYFQCSFLPSRQKGSSKLCSINSQKDRSNQQGKFTSRSYERFKCDS